MNPRSAAAGKEKGKNLIEMTMEGLKPKSELKKAYSIISSSERIFRYWCQWPETDLDLKDMTSIING